MAYLLEGIEAAALMTVGAALAYHRMGWVAVAYVLAIVTGAARKRSV